MFESNHCQNLKNKSLFDIFKFGQCRLLHISVIGFEIELNTNLDFL